MLLARGKIIYFNEASLAVDYFASIGEPCDELTNPADFFMEMMSIESIELVDEKTDSTVAKKDVIEQKYQQKIINFDNSYRSSALVNDHNQVCEGL